MGARADTNRASLVLCVLIDPGEYICQCLFFKLPSGKNFFAPVGKSDVCFTHQFIAILLAFAEAFVLSGLIIFSPFSI